MTTGSDGKRLFFALSPDDECRRYLEALQRQLPPLKKGRWVRPKNLHLTLAFLGNVTEPVIARLAILAENLRGHPMEIHLARCGLWRRQQILWVGPLSCPPPLTQLVDQLQQLQVSIGLVPEDRVYMPHVTLARRAQLESPLPEITPFCWRSDRFSLMQSVAESDGVGYSVIGEWRLSH